MHSTKETPQNADEVIQLSAEQKKRKGRLANRPLQKETMKSCLEAALAYAKLGIPVLPLQPADKQPLGALAPHGVKDATRDPDVIRSWFEKWPDANVGLAMRIEHADEATGEVDFQALCVVDIDDEFAAQRLVEQHGKFPKTWRASTGRGWHLFYKLPAGVVLRNRPLVSGVDLRVNGGYVVAAPSKHPNGRRYEWVESRSPDGVPIAELPAWIIALATRCAEAAALPASGFAPTRKITDAAKYAQAALTDECSKIRDAEDGTQNNQLNTSALKVGKLVGRGLLNEEAAREALYNAALEGNHPEHRIAPTIESGLSSGIAQSEAELAAEASEEAPSVSIFTTLETYMDRQKARAEKRQLWKGVLREGEVSLLLGRAMGGKSTFACALTKAIVNGTPFLGRDCTASKVAYLALERNGAIVGELFTKWGVKGLLFQDEMPAHHKTLASAEVLLEAEIKREGVQLVIVDHLQNIIRIEGGNEYAAVSNAMIPFAEIAKHTGCHFLILHHQGKREPNEEIDALGSEAYRAAADALIEATTTCLKKDSYERRFYIRAFSRGCDDLPKRRVVVDLETGSIHGEVAEGAYVPDRARNALLAKDKYLVALKARGDAGARYAELAQELGVKDQTARNRLSLLAGKHLAISLGEGRYKAA
jgi:Bifunctional DNA primase/polymerase, N-terminal/AAA domain